MSQFKLVTRHLQFTCWIRMWAYSLYWICKAFIGTGKRNEFAWNSWNRL